MAQSLPATTARDHFLRGYDAYRRGRCAGSRSRLRAALRIQPTHTWARFFLAACCVEATPQVAEAHLTTILAERPELYWAFLLRGIAQARLGDVALAEADFQQALAGVPDSSQATDFRYATLAIRGNYRAQRKEWQSAEADLMEAAALKPHAHQAPLYLAEAYESQRRLDEAQRQLTSALAAHDLSPAVRAGILLYRATRPNRDAVGCAGGCERVDQAPCLCGGTRIPGQRAAEPHSTDRRPTARRPFGIATWRWRRLPIAPQRIGSAGRTI